MCRAIAEATGVACLLGISFGGLRRDEADHNSHEGECSSSLGILAHFCVPPFKTTFSGSLSVRRRQLRSVTELYDEYVSMLKRRTWHDDTTRHCHGRETFSSSSQFCSPFPSSDLALSPRDSRPSMRAHSNVRSESR